MGRELNITGNVELSFFPWLGFSTGKASLSNAKEFSTQPFAAIDNLSLNVKLLPLLFDKVEIDTIQINGLSLHLTKNKEGINNWNDLFSSKTSNSSISSDSFTINSISIEKASIIWDNRLQNSHIIFSEFNLTTNKVAFNQPIAIDSSFTFFNQESALTESLHISSTLTFNNTLEVFNFSSLLIENKNHPKAHPNKQQKFIFVADSTLDLKQQTMDVSRLKFKQDLLSLHAKINVSNILDAPQISASIDIPSFNLAQYLKNRDISYPTTTNPEALSKLSTTFTLQANEESAKLQNIMITLDNSTITGSACFSHLKQPRSHFKLIIDSINADHYLPEKSTTPSTSTTNTAIKADPDIAERQLLPIETLKKLKVSGQLSINMLLLNGIKMQHINLSLNTKKLIRNSASEKTSACPQLIN